MSDHTFMPDSIGLRELAEYASGLRHAGGDPSYFVISADPHHPGDYHITHSHHKPEHKPGHIVVPADTPTVAPSRPKVTTVLVMYEDPEDGTEKVMVLDGTRYDALFWSEGAVEKFLIPYYASKYQWAAAEWVGKMSASWYGFIPTMTGAPAYRAEEGTAPLGMVHYPRSDYGEVEGGGVVGPGTDVHVLTAGEPKPVPLASHRR